MSSNRRRPIRSPCAARAKPSTAPTPTTARITPASETEPPRSPRISGRTSAMTKPSYPSKNEVTDNSPRSFRRYAGERDSGTRVASSGGVPPIGDAILTCLGRFGKGRSDEGPGSFHERGDGLHRPVGEPLHGLLVLGVALGGDGVADDERGDRPERTAGG